MQTKQRVQEISGHTREEYNEMIKDNALNIIYEADRARVISDAIKALESGKVLDVSYRMRHKNGRLIWVHLNGRRIEASAEADMFYAVFTGLSSESRLYQNITNETADSIYVIAKDTFELLYINETNNIVATRTDCLGEISDREKADIFDGRHFLIAEDNEINAEILCELLHMEGAFTELRVDGNKTLEAFKTAEPGTYDVILMDIQMPGLNGYETTRMIRNLKRVDAQTIPIVAMTANAFAEDVQAALDAGMDAHVAKPIDMDILRTVLDKVLKSKR